MTENYTVIKESNGTAVCIRRGSDEASIPVCEGNTDYQQYLAFVAGGGVAEEETLPDMTSPGTTSVEERLSAVEQYLIELSLV